MAPTAGLASPLAFLALPLSESDTRSAAVLIDELDTGQLKRLSKHGKGRLARFSAFTLNSRTVATPIRAASASPAGSSQGGLGRPCIGQV